MKIMQISLLAVLLALQFALWFGDKSVFDFFRLQRATADAAAQNDKHAARNDKLLAETVDLKTGGASVETRARENHGMIKPGETFYQVVE